MITRIRPVVRKEFRQISRDKRSLGVILFIPLFLLVMFGYAISLDVRNVPTGVMDLENSKESRDFLRAFENSEYFDVREYLHSYSQIDESLKGGEIKVALVIPRDFTRKLWRDKTCEVQMLLDGSNPTEASTVLGYLEVISQSHTAKINANLSFTGDGPPSSLDFRPRVWYNPELRSSVFLVPGLITLILVISAVVSTALSIVREKETGTMEQILVSPLRPLELVVGKTIPYIFISLISAIGVLGVSYLLFGVTIRGSYLLLLLVMLLFLLSCLGLGILISTISATQQVAFTLAVLITVLPSFLLSGFVFPIRNMPWTIQAITYLVPARYVLEALRGIIIKGSGLLSFWRAVLGLVVFSAATLALSTFRLRRTSAHD
jgi:ABC-2 type transport system permease protein